MLNARLERSAFVKTPDLIDLSSPTECAKEAHKSESTESEITVVLRFDAQQEYDELLKSTMIIPTSTNSTSQSKMLHIRQHSLSNANEATQTQDPEQSSNKDLFSPRDQKGLEKFVSFRHEDEKFSEASLSSLKDFKVSDDKRETEQFFGTDGESSELSFEFPSVEKFRLTEDHTFIQSSIIDQDLGKVESLMDGWTSDLKKKVLAEFSQSKIRLLEYYRQQIALAKEKQNNDMYDLLKENDSLKELVKDLENSLDRKDEIILNLTESIQSFKNKMQLQKSFSDWRIKHNDATRENFATQLAHHHYKQTLKKKVWMAWHSILERNWRDRVEKSCQMEAQEVCNKLERDCDEKIASINESLEKSKKEIERLVKERESYEETMKKAFMRGVCALNLEAMSVFQEKNSDADKTTHDSRVYNTDSATHQPEQCRDRHNLQIYRQFASNDESTYFSDPPPPVRKSVLSKKPSTIHFPLKNKPGKVQVIPARVRTHSSTGNFYGTTLSPPMASVVVERHQPISKQTIGHALACKYPKSPAVNYQPALLKKKSSLTSSHVVKVIN